MKNTYVFKEDEKKAILISSFPSLSGDLRNKFKELIFGIKKIPFSDWGNEVGIPNLKINKILGVRHGKDSIVLVAI